jgi:N-acyl-D-amino-acid deacylase
LVPYLWQGRTLAEVAAARGTDPLETAMDLIASDRSRIQTAYFSMSEENLRAALRRPWTGICSDSTSMAPEGEFLEVLVNGKAAISGGAFTGELAGRALAGPAAWR